MYGVGFYLQIIFFIFILWATTTALYMGVFHAHGVNVSALRKTFSSIISLAMATLIWFFLYSWTYLSW